ncbi:transcription factor TFIIIC subunit tfc4 [Thecaphora frezii]
MAGPQPGPSRPQMRKRAAPTAFSYADDDGDAHAHAQSPDPDDDSQDEYRPEPKPKQKKGSRPSSRAPSRPSSHPSSRPSSRQLSSRLARRSADSDSDSDSDTDSDSDSESDSESDSSDDDDNNDDDDDDDDAGQEPAARRRSGGAKARNGADDEAIDFESESFNRLVSSLQDTSRQAGALRRTWDTSIEEETLEFENELRATAGFKKKSRVKRSFREQNLSLEVRQLLSDANLLFVEQRLDEAIPKLEEVIRIEPTAMSAWRTLGLIYEEMGQEEKSIQCRIVGAHLQPRATDEWKRLAYRSIEKGLYRQAIYCLQQAIRLDKSDVDSIWDRALLLRDLGDQKAAINGLLDILKLQPHDASVVRELVPMLVAGEDFDRAIGILEAWLQHSITTFPDPKAPNDSGEAPSNTFDISELVTLADLLLMVRRPAEAITMIRQTARWIDGRAAETFWDAVPDDREFDEDRDDALARSREQAGYGRMVEMAPPHALDPEIRLRLGKARMMVRDVVEAKRHFEVLTDSDPAEATLIFGEVGDCFYENKLWAEALDVYTDLASVEWIDDVSLYAKLAACNHALGDLKEAARLYEPVVEASPDNLEWQMELAEVYEEMGEKEKSLEMLRTVVRVLQTQKEAQAAEDSAARDVDGDVGMAAEAGGGLGDTPLSFFDEFSSRASQRPTNRRSQMAYDRRQRLKLEKQRERDTLMCWRRLELLESHVFVPGFWRADVALTRSSEGAAGIYGSDESERERRARYRSTRQWLEEAGSLIESFRSTRKLHTGKMRNNRELRQSRRRALRTVSLGGGGRRSIRSQAQSLLYRLQDSMIEDELEAEHSEIPGMETSFQRALDQAQFRGIAIEEWIDVFAKYAMVLTKLGEERDLVNDVMSTLSTCNVVWGNHRRMMTVRLAWLSCAMYACDYETVFACLRWLSQEHQFHDQPLRLLVSVTNALGIQSMTRFVASRDIKFYQRRMRYIEAISNGLPHYYSSKSHHYIIPNHILLDIRPGAGGGANRGGGGEANRRSAMAAAAVANEDEDDEDERGGARNVHEDEEDDEEPEDDDDNEAMGGASRSVSADPSSRTGTAAGASADEPDEATSRRLAKPTKPSPIAELAYGYMMLASGGYQAPAAFFVRAFACQPCDALICLCAAVAFVGRSTNRQADNRHHLVLQALTFLQLYRRNLGLSDDETCQEVEYNYARLLHHIGLLHLAIPHYERVLELASDSSRNADGGGECARQGREAKIGFEMQREAAYNLALIYTLNGSAHLARELYRTWLVVE